MDVQLDMGCPSRPEHVQDPLQGKLFGVVRRGAAANNHAVFNDLNLQSVNATPSPLKNLPLDDL